MEGDTRATGGDSDITFRFRLSGTNDTSLIRYQHKLDDVQPDWQERSDVMRLVALFHDSKNKLLSMKEVTFKNTSAGWTGDAETSPLIPGSMVIEVPESAASVLATLTSAGPAAALGTLAMGDLRVTGMNAEGIDSLLYQLAFTTNKAPEVFDMLLGVLDEGRLSDALGRVADFTSTVILLTSNLGVREAGTRLGFGSADAEESAESYVTAAERFFRPEFFNRLDRVLPFRELKRAHLTAITERLLADVLQRDGLRQRQCLFECGAAAKTRLVELGLQPQLGARALKRVIEREVAQPLAAELAVRAPGNPLFIEMDHDGTGFKLHTRELRPMARAVFWPEILSGGGVPPATVLDAAYEALDRLADAIESQAPDGVVDLHALTPEQARYYQCREQVKRVERLLQAAEASLRTRPQASSRALIVPRAKPVKIVVRQWISGSPRFDRERAAELLNSALADGESADADLIETPVFAVARELALLEMMVAEPYQDEAVGLAIWGQGTDAAGEALKIQQLLYGLLRGHWGVEFRKVEPAPNNSPAPWQAGVWGVGPNVARLLEPLAGCWLLHAPHGGVRVMQLRLQACASVAQLEVVLSGPAAAATDETVVVSVGADGSWLSHLTGLVLPRLVPADAFRAFHLSALPLPAELQSVFNS
jgi:hypothetical protein